MKQKLPPLFLFLTLILATAILPVYAIEDFSTYTIFNSTYITATTNHVDFLNQRNVDAYLYKNYGSSHFADTTFTFALKIVSYTNTPESFAVIWELSNTLGSYTYMHDNYKPTISCIIDAHALYLGEIYDYDYAGSGGGLALNTTTWYFLRIIKSGLNLACYVYNDMAETQLIGSRLLILHNSTTYYQYLYFANTYNIDVAGGNGEVYIDNVAVTIINTPPPSGTAPFINQQSQNVVNIMVILLFLFLPALILGEMIGLAGILAGVALGAVCLGVVNVLPLWAILLIGLALIIIVLFGKDKL